MVDKPKPAAGPEEAEPRSQGYSLVETERAPEYTGAVAIATIPASEKLAISPRIIALRSDGSIWIIAPMGGAWERLPDLPED